MRRASLLVVLIFVLLLTGACSGGGNEPERSSPSQEQLQDPESDPSGDNGDEIPESISLDLPPIDQVEEVAALLYQGLIDGNNISGSIEEIYEALGIPVLDPETEMAQIETEIEKQSPFTLESRVTLISDALASGLTLNLESFIAEMNRDGFFALDTGGEVTQDYLSQNLSYLLDQNEYNPDEIQIALILALGRARASTLYGELPDPVWGDGLLDPLQSSLLWHLLDQIAADPQANALQPSPRASHLSAIVNPQRKGPLGDLLGSLGEASSHLTEFCNSALIFGHQSQLTLSENQVYRQTPGSKKPAGSEATFSLNYNYQPSTPEDKLSVQIGCPDLPSKGGRADRPVTWELIDSGARGASVESLGVFTPGGSTNNQGVSVANYLANLEVVPPYLQQDENNDAAAGIVKATADLYPGNEYLLEVLVNYGGKSEVEGVNMSETDLWVWYYTFPTVVWDKKIDTIGLNLEGIAFSCDGVNWVGTHVFNHTLPGFSVFTSAEFEFIVPETQLGDAILSNPIEVEFTGTWQTDDGPVPVTDTREVWLSITEREITMNFEPISATAIFEGRTIPIAAAFIFRSIPANLMTNNSCDGQ